MLNETQEVIQLIEDVTPIEELSKVRRTIDSLMCIMNEGLTIEFVIDGTTQYYCDDNDLDLIRTIFVDHNDDRVVLTVTIDDKRPSMVINRTHIVEYDDELDYYIKCW